MAHVNTALLISQATGLIGRANEVRQDEAVVKLTRVAVEDVARAGRSVAALAHEVAASWRRSAPE